MTDEKLAAELAGHLTVDDRGRTSLAKVRLKHRYKDYVVKEFPGGTIVLVPVVMVPAGTVTTAEILAVQELGEHGEAGEPE